MDNHPSPRNDSFDMMAQTNDGWQSNPPPEQSWNQPNSPTPTSHLAGINNMNDTLPELIDDELTFVVTGAYEYYSPERDWSSIHRLFLSLLQIYIASGSLINALGNVLQYDIQGVFILEHWKQRGSLPEHGLAALRDLAKAAYDREECRAFVYLCLMIGSLSSGDFSLWKSCHEILLHWAEGIYRDPESSDFDNSFVSQFVLKRFIWLDLIACATEGRISAHIRNYRIIFHSTEAQIMNNCSNEVTLVLVETIALAANPGHIRQATRKLNELRAQLAHSRNSILDNSTITEEIHTNGVQLLLEVTATGGNIEDPAVRRAVENVCEMSSWVENIHRRDFSFWIFLAGCHTLVPDILNNCRNMMHEIFDQSGDWSVRAAINVMEEVYHAREQRTAQPDTWRAEMNRRGLLLA